MHAISRSRTGKPTQTWLFALLCTLALLCGSQQLADAATQPPPDATLPTAASGSSPSNQDAADQALANPTSALDADRVTEPFDRLATALAESGREAAAAAVRAWSPTERPDATLAYFSQLELEICDASLSEPKVGDAFLAMRRRASEAAHALALAAAQSGRADLAYTFLWRALRENPESPTVRRQLGLPTGNTARVSIRPGRNAPAALGWLPRSYLVAETPHFRIFSAASRRETTALAADLERFFEVWSQIFRRQWIDDDSLCRAIAKQQPVAPSARHIQIALFADRETYLRVLAPGQPATNQSTGFYSPENQLTLLFAGEDADAETRYHEVTHQLLQEACGDVVTAPGIERGFWLVEGIACYMESVRFFDSFASVGGWEAERMQFARARWLRQSPPDLAELAAAGRDEVQQRDDLGAWYSAATAYTHLMMDSPTLRPRLLRYLQSIYRGRPDDNTLLADHPDWASQLISFLRLEANNNLPLYPDTQLTSLCLGGTEVTRRTLELLPPQPQLDWLDLRGLPVTSSDVARLLGDGNALTRLNLEQTRIDDELRLRLRQQHALEEIDLSFTAVGDPTVNELRRADDLHTLWLTGTRITDAAVPALLQLRALQYLDVQRSGVSADALDRLREARDDVQLNPLQLVTPAR